MYIYTSYHRLSLPLKLIGSGHIMSTKEKRSPRKKGPPFSVKVSSTWTNPLSKNIPTIVFFLVMVRLPLKKSINLHEIHDLQTFFQKLLFFFPPKNLSSRSISWLRHPSGAVALRKVRSKSDRPPPRHSHPSQVEKSIRSRRSKFLAYPPIPPATEIVGWKTVIESTLTKSCRNI